jgi:hypothetical protein
MALTRDFKETIRARAKRDPGFRKALLQEGIETFLSGDVETGKILLRDFINATVGFSKLSDVTHRSAKSLKPILGPAATPRLGTCLRLWRTCSAPGRAPRLGPLVHHDARIGAQTSHNQNADLTFNKKSQNPHP